MNNIRVTTIICLATIFLAACAPSTQAIQTAIAQTQAASGAQAAPTTPQNTPAPISAPLPTTAPSPTSEPLPTNLPSEVGTSRSNPAPLGSEVNTGDYKFSVTSIVRPADSIVSNASSVNDIPETGKEYMFVTVSVTCLLATDKQCSISISDFKALGSDGILIDASIVVEVTGLLQIDTTFYGGSTVTGILPYIVTKGDTHFLLVVQPNYGTGNSYYLTLPAK